jgi:hypothetical protein
MTPLDQHPDHNNKQQRDEFFDFLLAYGMLSAGMILLHYTLARTLTNSLLECRSWARKVLLTAQLVGESEFQNLSPLMSV